MNASSGNRSSGRCRPFFRPFPSRISHRVTEARRCVRTKWEYEWSAVRLIHTKIPWGVASTFRPLPAAQWRFLGLTRCDAPSVPNVLRTTICRAARWVIRCGADMVTPRKRLPRDIPAPPPEGPAWISTARSGSAAFCPR